MVMVNMMMDLMVVKMWLTNSTCITCPLMCFPVPPPWDWEIRRLNEMKNMKLDMKLSCKPVPQPRVHVPASRASSHSGTLGSSTKVASTLDRMLPGAPLPPPGLNFEFWQLLTATTTLKSRSLFQLSGLSGTGCAGK